MPPYDVIEAMPRWIAAMPTRVLDGDTLRAQLRLGLGIEVAAQPVRLLGIESYELSGVDDWLAREALRTLRAIIGQGPIYLDPPYEQRDRYGRVLAWVWVPRPDGWELAQSAMINAGMAWEWWPQGWGHHARWPPPQIRTT